MADFNACATCVYMTAFNGALKDADTIIFGNLHSPVVGILAAFATVAFLFKTQVQGFLATYLPDMERQRWFADMIEHAGRLALVAIALSSYSFWREWVVDNINLLIFTLAGAVAGEGGLISETSADLFNAGGDKEQFRLIMESIHNKTYLPIEELSKAITNMKLGFFEITTGVTIGVSMFLTSTLASLSNLMFFLILAMHKLMTVFVAGMGPLIMALWIFSATKHYAYSLLRFLAATGSTVVGASFLMGIALAVVAASLKKVPMKPNADGTMMYEISALKDWVLSGGLNLMIGAYLGMALFMVIAVVLGFATVLAQRPQLER